MNSYQKLKTEINELEKSNEEKEQQIIALLKDPDGYRAAKIRLIYDIKLGMEKTVMFGKYVETNKQLTAEGFLPSIITS